MIRYQFRATRDQVERAKTLSDLSYALNEAAKTDPSPLDTKGLDLSETLTWYRDDAPMMVMHGMKTGERGQYARGVLECALEMKLKAPAIAPLPHQEARKIIDGVKVMTGVDLTPTTLRTILRSLYVGKNKMMETLGTKDVRGAYTTYSLIRAYMHAQGVTL